MERGLPVPVVDSGFRDAVTVLVRRQPQQLHGKMAPSLGEKWQDPIQKAGVLVGWVEPDDSCEFESNRRDQIEPDNKHTLLQGSSVAQVTKVISGAVLTTDECQGGN